MSTHDKPGLFTPPFTCCRSVAAIEDTAVYWAVDFVITFVFFVEMAPRPHLQPARARAGFESETGGDRCRVVGIAHGQLGVGMHQSLP